MKKILLILLVMLVSGCVNDTQANKALQDPITLNLVKQSSLDQGKCMGDISPQGFINGCKLFDRAWCGGSYLIYINLVQKPITCDALDLRLKKLNFSVNSDELVEYYLHKDDALLQKNNELARQQQIENMANGK